tara:strand:- start:257 stop:553 length:297 start_codon:yes stop_codon:yes gene_type:complete
MANRTNNNKSVNVGSDSKVNNMVIIVDSGIEENTTFKEYFDIYKGDHMVLSCTHIINWDDVVDNIKLKEVRDDAVASGCLFGTEYPPDTPIVRRTNEQ